jgi:hypothetical protein
MEEGEESVSFSIIGKIKLRQLHLLVFLFCYYYFKYCFTMEPKVKLQVGEINNLGMITSIKIVGTWQTKN